MPLNLRKQGFCVFSALVMQRDAGLDLDQASPAPTVRKLD